MEILTLMKIFKNLTANMILNGKRMKSLFFKNKNKDATSLLVSHYRKFHIGGCRSKTLESLECLLKTQIPGALCQIR